MQSCNTWVLSFGMMFSGFIHTVVWISISRLVLLGIYIPKSKNSGSYGDFTFNFLRKCPTVFQSGCTILHSHQQCMRLPISLCPCQYFSLSVFLMIAILVGVKWYLTVVLICLFLMTNHVYVCVLSCFSCVWLFVTPWAVAHQAPLSPGFSRQEFWRGLPRPPSRGIFSIQGSKPASLSLLHWQAGSLSLVPPGKPHDGEHLFTALLAIWVCIFFGKMSVETFPPFKVGLSFLLLESSFIYSAQQAFVRYVIVIIFSHSEGCLFTFLIMPSEAQKF